MIDISKCPRFVDISAFQPNIDWQAYAGWARQWDGVARVIMKVSEGRGYEDDTFKQHRAGALSAGIESIGYYHYGRPDLANAAWDEAAYFESVLGSIRPSDNIILDMEIDTSRAGVSLAEWADEWLNWQVTAYNRIPIIYSYPSYISTFLQRPGLANYRLWYAKWQDPTTVPPCPLPWKSYETWQYTDIGVSIPGIPGVVDVDIFMGDFMIDLSMPAVAGFFQQAPGNAWQCKQNGFIVGNAMLNAYRDYGSDPLKGLHYLGLPVSNEYPVGHNPGTTAQDFELGRLGYDPTGELGGRPGQSNGVYPLHVLPEPNAVSIQKALEDIKLAGDHLADATIALNLI